MSHIKNKPKKLTKGFVIDNIYHNVIGFGMVFAGITGIEIKKNGSMFMGPFRGNVFVPVAVRSIHDDYRNFIDGLNAGSRGGICIRFKNDTDYKKYRKHVRRGMVITDKKENINSVDKFEAHVAIFRGKSSNIKVGYNSYINIGLIRGAIKFNRIRSIGADKEPGDDIEMLNTEKYAYVDLEFMKGHNCIDIGDKFLFRAGRVNGIGKVVAF